jgi:hypothetical protein
MSRKRRLESSGWVVPRRERREKPRRWWWWALDVEGLGLLEEGEWPLLRLDERIERARFLGGFG